MPTLILQPTSTAQWYALVNELESQRHLVLGDNLESYLVFLLMRFCDQPDLVNSIIGVEFLESLQLCSGLQQWRLRDVGDKCLLLSGLYAEHIRRTSIDPNYFVTLGQTAYRLVSNRFSNKLFAELAQHFLSMQDILLAMRELSETNEQHGDTLDKLFSKIDDRNNQSVIYLDNKQIH